MKGTVSVLALLARSTLYRLLAVLAAMTAAEYALFGWALRRAAAAGESWGLEPLLRQSGVIWAFGAAAVLVTAILVLPGCEFTVKTGYTLRRLPVGERQFVLLHFGYALLVYLILWGAQLAAALGLCRWYLAACPQPLAGQAVYLAFYRSEFLHPLLPLQEGILWARNGLLAVTLAAVAAVFPYRQRRGRRLLMMLPMALTAAVPWFPAKLGDVNWIGTAMFCAVLLGTAVYALCLEDEDDVDPKKL